MGQNQKDLDLMTSEHAFLRQRLVMVERWLASPDREFVPARRGRVRRRAQSASRLNLTYRREVRLLRKLLSQTKDGQVLKALNSWRSGLGEFLRKHQQEYHEMQDNYDAWWRLPWGERQYVPRPPKPPAARHIDVDGIPWIVDDRLLALLDDLIERLQKWVGGAQLV